MNRKGPLRASHCGINASVFGSFQLTAADGTKILISNRRAQALLAMLSLVRGEAVAREQVSKLLWPGRFETHAKASLRQCLLELGKLLEPIGAEILIVTRSTVSVSGTALATDLDDLERALAEGQIADAARQLRAIGTAQLIERMDFGDAFNAWLACHRARADDKLQAAVDRALAAEWPGTEADCEALRRAWESRNSSALRDTSAAPADVRARIAVLPFRSLNAPDGQDYFADGIVDEMITTLGQVPQLLVAGRTSSFHLRNSELASAAIARALNVAHLIEGSVQRQGDRVRIFVRLIDGANGFESWGHRYDGSLNDIFTLQETVAQAVTAAIGSVLSLVMQPPLVHGLTHSKRAYDLYLQGRALYARLFGDGLLERAAALLNEAVALDPNFAEAWVLLGDVHQRMGLYSVGTDKTGTPAIMADCVRKALAIRPGLGMAYGLLGLHEFTRKNIVGALDLAFQGYEVEPKNSEVAARLGTLLLFCGLTQRGMRYLDEAIDQNPVDGRMFMCRSAGQFNLGNIDAAISDAQRCVDLGFPSMWLGVAHAAAGNHDLAVECYQHTRAMINNSVPPPKGIAPMPPKMMDAYWLVAAKGVCSGQIEDRENYCRVLDFLHETMMDKEHLAITLPAVFMGHADLVFKTIGARITLQNLACLMSIWADRDPIRRLWQHDEFIPFAQRIGMAAAWDKYGWPDLLSPPSNRSVPRD